MIIFLANRFIHKAKIIGELLKVPSLTGISRVSNPNTLGILSHMRELLQIFSDLKHLTG